MDLTTRAHILARLEQNAGDDLDLGAIAPEHRYLAVFLLDDDTQTARIIESASTEAAALAALSAPSDLYLPEYLIDLAAELGVAVRPVVETAGGVVVETYTVPFDEDHLAFA